jgi:tetratricopeptide (TPR) repeat protein
MHSHRFAHAGRLLVWPVMIITCVITFHGSGMITAALGNIALTTCQKHVNDISAHPSLCAPLSGSIEQRGRLEVGQSQILLSSGQYDQVAKVCGASVCACTTPRPPGLLVDELRTYSAVLAYHAEHQQFLAMSACADRLPSSSFIWGQAVKSSRRDQSELATRNQELAYVLDWQWATDWDRGMNAFRQGGAYFDAGDWTRAEAALLRATESLSKTTHTDRAAYLARSFSLAGDAARQQGMVDEAIAAHISSIQSSPRDASRSFVQLVQLWQAQGQNMAAIIRQFDEIRSENAADPYLTSGPARALIDIGAVPDVIPFVLAAPRSVQEASAVLGTRGQLAERVGDHALAQQYFSRALDTARDDDPLEAAQWAVSLAEIKQADGNLVEGIDLLELAIQLNPGAEWNWYRLAEAYRESNQSQEARTAIEQALRRDPDNATFVEFLHTLDQTQ